MENAVPTLALEALDQRREQYLGEIDRFIRAAIAVMRRSDDLDPRVSEIVREAGLSNQAFYRHFRGKDELLLAILDDGLRQLLALIEERTAGATDPAVRARRWVEAIMAQAANTQAAANTRPFVVHSQRLAHQFPEAARRSAERLQAPLRDALAELPSVDPPRDAEAVYHLAMGRMHAHLLDGTRPSKADVEHLVRFALRGVGHKEAAWNAS